MGRLQACPSILLGLFEAYMTAFIIRRLLSLASVLLIVSVIIFFLMNAVPGGPFSLGEHYSQAILDNMKRKYGLDKPVTERYWNYLTSALHLDFGNSFAVAGNPPVIDLIARVWPLTLQ